MRSHLVYATLLGVLAGAAGGLQAQSPPTVIDDADRQVNLSEHPSRIVSLVPVATEIVYSLGEGNRLVGRTRFDDYPPAVLDVPSVGDAIRPSIEAVLLRRPDLVIVIGGADNASAVRELERLGVPFMVVVFNSLSDLDRNVMRLGALLARPDAARALSASMREGLEEVRNSVRGLNRPLVYYDIGYPPAITAGAGSYINELIWIAGGRNAFSDLAAPSPSVSLESIVARDPDLILYPMSEDLANTTPAWQRPGWEALRAVREGQIRGVDAGLVHRLGPRVVEAARMLARVMHPSSFGSQP